MADSFTWNELIGSPQEIHQFMMNTRSNTRENIDQTTKKNKAER